MKSETSMPMPVYKFPKTLRVGTILSRPNRFIMMVRSGGRTIRCHCPTTGRLGDLKLEGLPCLYSTSTSAKRKTAHTVEAISTSPGGKSWVGINQTAANRYFEFFLRNGALARLARGEVQREVKLGKSRIDFLIGNVYVEVKTPLIMLPASGEVARVKRSRFDSFDRLIRHMGELQKSLSSGMLAKIVLCFLYDAKPFKPPAPDGTNTRILAAARAAEMAGVERWQVNFKVDPEGVSLIRYFRSKPYTGETSV
ncbi:MAG TPA: DNA/RNA nuclease SfsA [Nitrososphaerales archaeon]|nr:DNA/RNA nuclease SfsA [Nitrososphaerales archaeon]